MKKWHKSSYSGGNGGDCVEVVEGSETLVRDTRNKELGHLTFTANEWNALLRTFKTPN
ncbi:DUF397 domain-containing protein [Nocardiopsis flavescens]|uniref:DUF397 domain-containing protein n=1 Tax=Nocardiopsis flavescens TaxID=758803 RepID=UPI00364D8DAA